MDLRKLINNSLQPELPTLQVFNELIEFENLDKQFNYYCFVCGLFKTENYALC